MLEFVFKKKNRPPSFKNDCDKYCIIIALNSNDTSLKTRVSLYFDDFFGYRLFPQLLSAHRTLVAVSKSRTGNHFKAGPFFFYIYIFFPYEEPGANRTGASVRVLASPQISIFLC